MNNIRQALLNSGNLKPRVEAQEINKTAQRKLRKKQSLATAEVPVIEKKISKKKGK